MIVLPTEAIVRALGNLRQFSLLAYKHLMPLVLVKEQVTKENYYGKRNSFKNM